MYANHSIKSRRGDAIRRERGTPYTRVVRATAALALLSAISPGVFAQAVYLVPPAVGYVAAPPPESRAGYWSLEGGQYVWRSGPPVAFARPVQPYVARERQNERPQVERLATDALFRFDRGDVGDITASGIADLDQIAARLHDGNFDRVEIRGYTDRLGSDQYNIDLSERRADAVKAVLVQKGIPAGKIRTVGLGERDPIVQCQEPDGAAAIRCLQPNRRVEIVTYLRPGDNRTEGSYAAPQEGYVAPQSGYSARSGGYAPPQQEYAPPDEDVAPSAEYAAPSEEYAAPSPGYVAPRQGYATPPAGYTPPSQGYATPNSSYAPQPAGYPGGVEPDDRPPGNGY